MLQSLFRLPFHGRRLRVLDLEPMVDAAGPINDRDDVAPFPAAQVRLSSPTDTTFHARPRLSFWPCESDKRREFTTS